MVEWSSGQIAECLAHLQDISRKLDEVIKNGRIERDKLGANLSVQQGVPDVRKKRGRPRKTRTS